MAPPSGAGWNPTPEKCSSFPHLLLSPCLTATLHPANRTKSNCLTNNLALLILGCITDKSLAKSEQPTHNVQSGDSNVTVACLKLVVCPGNGRNLRLIKHFVPVNEDWPGAGKLTITYDTDL